MWDIAGSKNYRKVWHSYIEDANLIVFMIDGSDHVKFNDTKEALQGVVSDKKIKGKTLVFLINKNVEFDSTKDKDQFSLLPWQDLVNSITRDTEMQVFIEETCCLG